MELSSDIRRTYLNLRDAISQYEYCICTYKHDIFLHGNSPIYPELNMSIFTQKYMRVGTYDLFDELRKSYAPKEIYGHLKTCPICKAFNNNHNICPDSKYYLTNLINDDDLIKLRTLLDIYIEQISIVWRPSIPQVQAIQQVIVKTVYKFREIVFPSGKHTKAARH
jgi:hypothetical protein